MSEPPVEYIELNLSNYDDADVSRLNEWGVWAVGEIERIRAKVDELECTLGDEESGHQETLRLWNEAKAENARLLARDPYVQHLVSCYLFSNCGDEPRRCTCGLDEIMKGA